MSVPQGHMAPGDAFAFAKYGKVNLPDAKGSTGLSYLRCFSIRSQ